MTEDPFDFFRGKVVHQGSGHRNCRMFRIPSGSKCIGYLVVDNVYLGHGQVGPLGQPFYNTVQARSGIFIYLPGPVLGKDHLITVPVCHKIHAQRKDQHDHHTLPAAGGIAHHDQQQGQ